MRALAAATLVLPLLANGCSAADPDAAGAPPTPSASASETPTAPREGSAVTTPDPRTGSPALGAPGPPPASDDRPGRGAFAEYVLQAWIHALNTNDPGPLLALSGEQPCEGCRALATELGSRAEQGWYVDLAGVHVASASFVGEGRTTRVLLAVSLPESTTYFADGSYRSTNPAHAGRTFEVETTFTGKRFRLDAFSLY